MSDAELEVTDQASAVEAALVIVAMVILYGFAALGALFILVLLGAPEGDDASMAGAVMVVLVSVVAAASARSSMAAGRIAMAIALALPVVLVLYLWIGG